MNMLLFLPIGTESRSILTVLNIGGKSSLINMDYDILNSMDCDIHQPHGSLTKGDNVKENSTRLGHADVLTTLNIYSHALRKADEIAAGHFSTFFKVDQDEKDQQA